MMKLKMSEWLAGVDDLVYDCCQWRRVTHTEAIDPEAERTFAAGVRTGMNEAVRRLRLDGYLKIEGDKP